MQSFRGQYCQYAQCRGDAENYRAVIKEERKSAGEDVYRNENGYKINEIQQDGGVSRQNRSKDPCSGSGQAAKIS